MSGRIVGNVLDNAPEDLTSAELLVLIAVAEDARDGSRIASYSDAATVSYRTRLKPGTVRNALSELCRRGLLVSKLGAHAHAGVHQVYEVTRLAAHHRAARSVTRE